MADPCFFGCVIICDGNESINNCVCDNMGRGRGEAPQRGGRRNALLYHYYIEYNYALPFFYITVYQRPFKNE